MRPDAAGLAAAIEALKSGEPIVIPTDTVYGLAVRAGDPLALDRVFALKKRPAEKAVAVLVGDVGQASEFAHVNKYERRVAERCWPGALTLILNRLENADQSIGRADGTIGVRCPNHPFVRMLALAVGPLATTSANLSGAPTPVEAHEAASALDGDVALTIDDGVCDGQASTVARVDRDGDIMVLRQGEFTQRQLEKIARPGLGG